VLGEWIVIAWEGISSEYVVTGFKICCISNALDGTENDFLRQSEENKESDCEEDGGGNDNNNDDEQSENENSE
jgi:hypothetical protein